MEKGYRFLRSLFFPLAFILEIVINGAGKRGLRSHLLKLLVVSVLVSHTTSLLSDRTLNRGPCDDACNLKLFIFLARLESLPFVFIWGVGEIFDKLVDIDGMDGMKKIGKLDR